MADLALEPVAEALFTLLQDDDLLEALPGGWHDDVPQQPTYPFGWYELRERDIRGLGTGGLPEIELRTHIFSEYAGLTEARTAARLTVAVLKDVALTVTGYSMCGHIFYDETIPLSDQELNGIKCHEIVSMFRIYVEEA